MATFICRRLLSTSVTSKSLKAFDQIPTVRGLPIIGTAIPFLLTESSDRLHKYIDRRHKEMGPIVQESIGPVCAVFVSDPDIMRAVFTKYEGKYPVHVVPDPWSLYNETKKRKRGLFFLSGEEWLHYRRILNRLVLKPDAEAWLKTPIMEATESTVRRWRESCTDGLFQPVMPDDMYKSSIQLMMSVVLGSAYKPFALENDQVLGVFAKKVHKIFVYSAKMVKLPAKFYMKLKFPAWKHFVESVDDSINIGEELMQKMYRMEDCGDGLLFKLKNENFSKEDMSRIVIDFIMAAGDTTAVTTQWALYLLCKNPEVRKRYLSVIDNEVEGNSYCRGIIKETLRLYPPAPFVTRLLPEDCEIAGYQVPAGTMIALSIYTSSRDPRYFPEPMKFDPTRWNKNEDAPGINAYSQASMPFAIGARSCIGRKIAMLQITELLKKINKNFDIELLNDNIEDIMQMVTVPSEPFKFLLKDRQYKDHIHVQN